MRSVITGCLATVAAVAFIFIFFVAGFLFNAYRTSIVAPAPQAVSSDEAPSIATPPSNFQVFYEALGLMRDEFYGELPDQPQLNYAAIRGVLANLDDPNTILVEPPEHKQERERFSGEFGGIGAQVSTNDQQQLVIVAPIDDTPAARAELRANDIILEVDSVPITGMKIEESVALIRGEVGTEVTLLVLRGESEPFNVTLVRDKIPDPTVDYSIVEDSEIGYIRLGFFSSRTTGELERALEALKEEGAKKFILDLRNNPGGILDAAIGTSSLFIEDGVIAHQERNDGSRTTFEAEGNAIATTEPMFVLINAGSASASEILAGALQASGRATLVGTQSYGKGTVQIPYTLSDGSSLHVTIAHWLTPHEIDLSNEGLIPEIYVEPTEEALQAGEDPILTKALEALKEVE